MLMEGQCEGLAVKATVPATDQVIVEAGSWRGHDGQTIEKTEPTILTIRFPGQKQLLKQRYKIHGEAEACPSGWNGESIRGSGGDPYQRMVADSLQVYNDDRTVCYIPRRDYVFDEYWGTIKRHPHGNIPEAAMLSLDYAVWLCRYDAIVLQMDGSIKVVEGQTEAQESRELMLPDPPLIEEGYLLANVFTGWGLAAVESGECHLVQRDAEGIAEDLLKTKNLPILGGHYLDMCKRNYFIEVVEVEVVDRFSVRMAATGIDYGLGCELNESTLRWTPVMEFDRNESVPLLIQTAYAQCADWGLQLDFSQVELSSLAAKRLEVAASPQMIFDLRNRTSRSLPEIPMLNARQLHIISEKAAIHNKLNVVFYGESTTRSGRWPYQVISALRKLYSSAFIQSTNAAIGGEGSMSGIHRLEDEILNMKPDLVFLEYLINDSCSGDQSHVETTVREIIERIQEQGAICFIVTNNGMNPLFSPLASSSNFFAYHKMYQRLAEEYQCPFVGVHDYFHHIHHYGRYFLTELKGNMVNHSAGNVDPGWAPIDEVISRSILHMFTSLRTNE